MKKPVTIAYIGAGHVNFGGGEGPWDHASRFERIPGVECVGVADVDLPRAEAALSARRSGPRAQAWAGAQVFDDWRRMMDQVKPDAVVVGLPPDAHGHTDPPRDVEIALAEAGAAMLVEKPLGIADPATAEKVAERLRRAGAIVSVGYMFRYAAAVAKMREILSAAPGGPRVFLGRYDCAYSDIASPDWWDAARSGGPIIEQATHFLDLARYLCGEVEAGSIQVTRIGAGEAGGELADIPSDAAGRPVDAQIPIERRAPRATLAQWRFAGGAVGALAHGVLLHQRKYESALEVWCDGVRCVLEDPYGHCRLGVRGPDSEETHWQSFDDDCYFAEDAAFIEAVRAGDQAAVRSTYDDALETYRLSCLITRAGRTSAPIN